MTIECHFLVVLNQQSYSSGSLGSTIVDGLEVYEDWDPAQHSLVGQTLPPRKISACAKERACKPGKGLGNNYTAPRAEEFLLANYLKWLRFRTCNEYHNNLGLRAM